MPFYKQKIKTIKINAQPGYWSSLGSDSSLTGLCSPLLFSICPLPNRIRQKQCWLWKHSELWFGEWATGLLCGMEWRGGGKRNISVILLNFFLPVAHSLQVGFKGRWTPRHHLGWATPPCDKGWGLQDSAGKFSMDSLACTSH